AADYAAGEAQMRTLLHRRIGLPLSAKLVSEGFGKESDNSGFGSDRRVYFGSFEPAVQNGAWYCYGQFAPETGRLVWATFICADHSISQRILKNS
ncbi:MAG: hypothetical protein HUJ75_03830, partial [Parasporobacterium sp.]|nr:hypothetical protein [Parasporobacterium sp.]